MDGICANVSYWVRCNVDEDPVFKTDAIVYLRHFSHYIKEVCDRAEKWPNTTGVYLDPVKSLRGYENNMWKNPLRLELLDWLIEQVEKEILAENAQ